MTGEMCKPKNAEKDEYYWEQYISPLGYRVLGDPGYLIRPNYPEIFDLKDFLEQTFPGLRCSVEPFDVYCGPYISTNIGISIWYGQSKMWLIEILHPKEGENEFKEVDFEELIREISNRIKKFKSK
ncbi:MAG: hypothetical protein DRN14_03685 [Thermoplasmata archaeon]|nr:MAG: hypothetical protein DRN14_03685 [Thermoplasmata archaeon]